MRRTDYVIVVAGGKGLRMGGEVPKQFLPVGGRPVLMRTLEAFRAYDEALRIILVLPRAQQDYWHALCRTYDFRVTYQLADGGETRFHSVRSGLALVPDEADGVVGVHDGVRPFVSRQVIADCYEAAAREGAAVPVVPVVETLRRRGAPGESAASVTVDRDAYCLVQTPQVFLAPLLKQAYNQPYIPAFTDDASVVETAGHPVVLCAGNRENIKITTPFDLQVAAALLAKE